MLNLAITDVAFYQFIQRWCATGGISMQYAVCVDGMQTGFSQWPPNLNVYPHITGFIGRKSCEYRFGKLAARLHDAKAQGNNLCGQQEVDYFLFVGFHQST